MDSSHIYMRMCGDIQWQSDPRSVGGNCEVCVFPCIDIPQCCHFVVHLYLSLQPNRSHMCVPPTHPPVCVHSPYPSHHSIAQCILGSSSNLQSHRSIHHLGHKDKLQGGRVKFMVVWLEASCYAKQCHGSARLDWKENSGEQNATMPWIV